MNGNSVSRRTGTATFSSGIATATNYTRWVASVFKDFYGQNIAEIGVGHGGYYDFLPSHQRYVGVDIDAECIELAKSKHPGLDFIHGDIAGKDTLEALREREVDTVLCVNVLEHIADDEAMIEALISILPARGRLLLFVPAFMALYGEMDRLAGHYRRYHRRDFKRLLGRVGRQAQLACWSYGNCLGGVGWWLNKSTSRQTLDDQAINRQIAFFDRYVLPLSRIFDRLAHPFFGQSLWAVIEKSSRP